MMAVKTVLDLYYFQLNNDASSNDDDYDDDE